MPSQYQVSHEHLLRRDQFMDYKIKVSTILDTEKKSRITVDNQFLLNRLVRIQKKNDVRKQFSDTSLAIVSEQDATNHHA